MGEDVKVLKVVKQDKKFTIELEEGGGAGLGTILSSRDKKTLSISHLPGTLLKIDRSNLCEMFTEQF